MMKSMNCAVNVLLTGAGFTHNFGTPLAKGMWNLIFNHPAIQSSSRLKEYLLQQFDYEQAYHDVMNISGWSEDQKDLLNKALRDAYEDVDVTLRDYWDSENSGCRIYLHELKTSQLIDPLRQAENGKGFIFTLNHDLFLERHGHGITRPYLPGIENAPIWFTSGSENSPEHAKQIILPSDLTQAFKEEELTKEHTFYVKLHGSANWQSRIRPHQMVIGIDKLKQIEAEPLLKWYFEVFRDVLLQPERRLLVIGYGFRDEHVNQIIADAISESGLKLYVIGPTPAQDFVKNLPPKHAGILTKGLAGYFEHTLSEIFNWEVSNGTRAWQRVRQVYFH